MRLTNQTPVIISVGQFTNHGETQDDLLCPADLAAIAVNACLEQAGGSHVAASVDTVAVCRLFAESSPALTPPFGASTNLPRSIAKRTGMDPVTAIYASSGGDSAQRLVNQQCERIYSGESRGALVVGVEATRTTKRAAKLGVTPNWHEAIEGSLIDEGFGDLGTNGYELAHGIGIPVQTYSLFEHALRTEKGDSVSSHLSRMGELFAPFTKVAAENPYAQFRVERTADELKRFDDKNYPITDIYPKYVVAQDSVDQSGAVLIVAESLADELGVPREQRVYLHGYGSAKDRPITERPKIHQSRAIKLAGERALSSSKKTIDQIAFFDIYSCFPSAVICAQEALGIQHLPSEKLTLTGGLPFFGGAGNSYSIHAIVEMVKTLRMHTGEFGMVLANGGYLSKEAIGIYSTDRPVDWRPVDCSDIQRSIDTEEAPKVLKAHDGLGRVLSYTVAYAKGSPRFGYVLGETTKRERFLAAIRKGDSATIDSLLEGNAIGREIRVEHHDRKNYFEFV